ncbi:MAG: phosphonate ABC transporter substrate-binding protein [Lautropia sp.]
MKARILPSLAVAAGLSMLASPSHAATDAIGFGIISTESTRNLKTAWAPLLADMEKAVGVKVNAFFAPDYAGIIEAMRFNKVQLGWFGNKSAIEAVDRSQGEVFARNVNKDGTEGYYSLLVVHKDSPLRSLDDVLKHRATLTLGFGDPNSTSGTVVPGYYAFANNGVDPTRDFKRTVRANHETNLLAVLGKQVDVVTNNTEAIERLKHTQPGKADELREIWRSPLIPSDPIVWRKDLDPAMKAKVRDFMLNYGSKPEQKKIVEALNWSGFRASSDRQLVPIRQIELAKARAKLDADTAMDAAEKQRRIGEIDGQLKQLQAQLAQK